MDVLPVPIDNWDNYIGYNVVAIEFVDDDDGDDGIHPILIHKHRRVFVDKLAALMILANKMSKDERRNFHRNLDDSRLYNKNWMVCNKIY